MKIFLDVGTHEGQTLEEVVKPHYAFDHIMGFEPMPKQCYEAQVRFAGVGNLAVYRFGLSDKTRTANLYGSNNNLESSIFAEKNDADENIITQCEFKEASEFFRSQIPTEATVIMKLNCEGAEIPILNNLIDSGEIWKVSNVMIDFDIRKVRGMEHEAQKVLNRMIEIGFERFSLCEDVMIGETHQNRIANWLKIIGV